MHDSSYGERVELTRLIIALLDEWGVSAADQVRLLDLPTDIRPSRIRQFRHNTPLPEDASVMERVEHLAGIADALRTSYPRHPQMGTIWMNRANDRFDGRTPIAVMIADGLDGVVAVRAHLDCAFDWDLSGSKA